MKPVQTIKRCLTCWECNTHMCHFFQWGGKQVVECLHAQQVRWHQASLAPQFQKICCLLLNLQHSGPCAKLFQCSSNSLTQWNLYLLFPDNSFSRIHRSISMVPERIIFQLWLPHIFFSRIHCFFFRPPTKTMNRGFTVFSLILSSMSLSL
jgi:hypothetical protein